MLLEVVEGHDAVERAGVDLEWAELGRETWVVHSECYLECCVTARSRPLVVEDELWKFEGSKFAFQFIKTRMKGAALGPFRHLRRCGLADVANEGHMVCWLCRR